MKILTIKGKKNIIKINLAKFKEIVSAVVGGIFMAFGIVAVSVIIGILGSL